MQSRPPAPYRPEDSIGAVTVRPAAASDFEPVGRLFEASYPVLMRPAYDPEALERALPAMTRANPMLLESGTFFVAETDPDGTIGCGGWTRERPGKGDTAPGLGHVRHFATHPAHVGRGVGRSVYNACKQQALSLGIERFECYASLNAEGFYAGLGFEVIDRVEIAMTDEVRLPAVWMRAELGPT